MNKYQRLIKRIVATAIKCGIALALAGGIYAAAAMYEGGVLKEKADIDSKFSQDEALRNNLRTQIEKSGLAEKKFIEFQGNRTIADFSANFEKFQAFLKTSKDRYRLSIDDFDRVNEVLTDKADLKNFPYDVMIRPKIVLKIKAISDVHLFSFIRDMQRNAPGLVHIENVSIKRLDKADLTDDTINSLKTGASPLLVEAAIQLTWMRFVEKDKKPAAATPSATQ